MRAYLMEFTGGYEDFINLDEIVAQMEREVYDGIKTTEMAKLVTLVLRSRIEEDPAYAIVSARQLARRIADEAVGNLNAVPLGERVNAYKNAFVRNIKRGVEAKKYYAILLTFNLEKLAEALKPERDDLFKYIGIETLHDRYFVV